jgi:predicted O-methyltransferase YrrM
MFCVPGFELFRMALYRNSLNYLEIGCYNGDSIAELARMYPNRIIYAIDPFIEDGYTSHDTGVDRGEYMSQQEANTRQNIEGLENVVLFKMTSQEFSEMLTDEMVELMNIGHVLVDGSHHYEDVVVDYELATRLFNGKQGIVVFDDADLPGVAQARTEFGEKYKDKIDNVLDLYITRPGHIITYFMNGHIDANEYYSKKNN